ncbi:MAG: hypothetical protein R3E32_09655 [Chitinophagales bacterium]
MWYLKSNLTLLLVVILTFSACSKDDECEVPALSENIIGTWNPQLSGGEVEFRADGTYIDEDDSLFGFEVNGVVFDDKSYSLDGNTLTLTASPSGGGGSSSVDFEITENNCDEIKLEILGFTETLKRK